ncbi:ABC transporter ATP-binding protein/permease [Rhizobiaceae bacterium BDR2-2]|uniref:ABC transporter ATP-binding protein/permease n=1 Tax=Ectorhizobium quercum TaxID=2965071 RepID=A0AAE3MYW0_9HYPH|nr:ABC transporter ATP-binding protein/permease [Ectorhizobium quercum]MCX8996841.1 ABC transporter ATP-binding protein/permease [Ectorhizobium quercum]
MKIAELADGQAPAPDVSSAYELPFIRQIAIMIGAFWRSGVRNRVLAQAFALLSVILATAYAQITLNEWNVPFYNAIEQRDVGEFLRQLQIFAGIAGSLLLLNVCQTWLNQMAALSMREGLTNDLVETWLKGRRALRLAASGTIGVNPDQRLHEDARNLSEITTSLSIGLVQSSILLGSFIGVLWALSSDFAFVIGSRTVVIPGYMVWAAFIYAGLASMLSRVVGHRLVGLNAERYSREADLRFLLMRTNENLTAISLARGEQRERKRILERIGAVLAVTRQLVTANTNLTWVSAGFGWLSQVAPIIIAAPVYFSGNITFGGLMMAVGAFNQVNLALRWYVTNFGQIADWRATLGRVSAFRSALQDMDRKTASGAVIDYRAEADETIRIENLTLCLRAGAEHFENGLRLREGGLSVRRGERVMVNGDPGVNRHLLFEALAGNWPWGRGTIGLPPGEGVLFMPQTGYLAGASLQEVLTYPLAPEAFSRENMLAALDRAGLARLKPILDTTARWDKVLDFDDQMKLRFANALLLKPDFIVIDDLFDGLEQDAQASLAGIVEELGNTGILYVGRSQAFAEAFSPRIVHLEQIRPPDAASPL